MHEPRFKHGIAIGYALSPTGADHAHSLHDTAGIATWDENGFVGRALLRGMGLLEPSPLDSWGPEKVRAALYHTINRVLNNCLLMCSLLSWTLQDQAQIVRAATGWDVSDLELFKVGERALTLGRVFNVREGLGVKDDWLLERSFGPATDGPLARGGVERQQLRQAIHAYYEMAGWDRETGIPECGKLCELDVSWAIDHLPAFPRCPRR
jgi:aldehyde:ferredoxin oxidoreductase